MDNSHVALVSLSLEKDSFSEYRCDRDMTLGMNLASLQKIIKCANNDDNCKLSANEDADTLNLQFQGKRELRISGTEKDEVTDKGAIRRRCTYWRVRVGARAARGWD